jgi:DNA-binding MarR family transcriptional regulator
LIGYHLRRAQVHLFADFARTMADAQMTPGQFGVISLIGANPGLTQSALARAVGIERSTMVAVIDGLQERGLVERCPSPVDRRSYALVLTADGAALLDRLIPLVRAHERNVARRLSAADKDKLIELLTKLSS